MKTKPSSRRPTVDSSSYDEHIAVDWSQKIMAIARLSRDSDEPHVFEREADVRELKKYLQSIKGKKIVAFEETTSAHWLYLELLDYADKLLICDPYRNRLLSEGPKTDKIDAGKLCRLLKAGLLKEVFHSTDRLYEVRRLVSGYNDVIRWGVSILNQQNAMYRATGQRKNAASEFVLHHLEQSAELYVAMKADYGEQFKTLCRRHACLKALISLDGIGKIGAVKIVSAVVDPHRFPNVGHYLSYCGLVKLERLSGGRRYGKKTPRYNRTLKSVYKTAALAALKTKNPFRDLYDKLLKRGVAEYNARHAVARAIARVSFGILKSGKHFDPELWSSNAQKQGKSVHPHSRVRGVTT